MSVVGVGRSLICVAVVLGSGCGDSDDPSAADAGVADAAAFVPTLGLWRIVSTGTNPMCETGGGPQSIALKRQHVFELTSATPTQAAWKTSGGVTFSCDGAGDNLFECTITPEVKTLIGRPTYTIDYTSTSEVLSATSMTAESTSTTTCSGNGCDSTTPCVDTLTYDFTPYVETEVLVASACDQEATLSSTDGFKETYIDFVNDTDAPLTRFWLDYAGTRRDYADVPANTTVRARTFETHSWIVEDEGGTCLGIYTAGPDLNTITIQ